MLSGGLDSGMLAYAFGKSDNNYQCLSIYKANHPDNEIKFAKANAANAGLNIEPIEIPEFDNQYLRRFFMHAEEEPNSGPEPAKLLSEYAANENYKVLYSALGPDEIFGGYPYFQFVRKYAKVSSIFSLIPAFVFPSKYRSKVRDIKRYGIAYYPFLSRSLFSWESIVKIIHNHNKKIPEHPLEYIRKQVNEINPQFKHLPILKQVSYLEMHYYIGSHHSVRSDIPSMQHSIEMRFPFLDHEFVQKYFNQTNTFNELKNKPKPEMYRFSAPFLPNEVMQMPKRGFTIPLAKNNSTKKPRQIWYLEALVNTFPQLKKDFLEKS
jgi:asparagine synthase (glutamine-hydrolysing)